jgi:hypothetical protein
MSGRRPPLWSGGQSSWLQIQRLGFDSRPYQIFWEVVGLERGPLSLVSKTEELFGRKCSGSGLESREYYCLDPSRWPRDTLYPQKLTLSSPTSIGRSVGIVRSRTQATEFSFLSGRRIEYVFFKRFYLHIINSTIYVSTSCRFVEATCEQERSEKNWICTSHSEKSASFCYAL